MTLLRASRRIFKRPQVPLEIFESSLASKFSALCKQGG